MAGDSLFIEEFTHKIYGAGQWRRIKTGFSTTNFEFQNNNHHYLVRYAPDFPVLGVLRQNEALCSELAGRQGIAPLLRQFQPLHEGYIFIYDYIENAEYINKNAHNITQIAQILHKIHHQLAPMAPAQTRIFNAMDEITRYKDYFNQFEYAKQFDWQKFYQIGQKCNQIYNAPYNIFGHHDCLMTNFIQAHNRIWVIDWEYAGMGTAFFDMAGLSVFGEFDNNDNDILLNSYFNGHVTGQTMQNFTIMRYLAYLREAFWFLVSHQYIAKPDYDYLTIADEVFTNLEHFYKHNIRAVIF